MSTKRRDVTQLLVAWGKGDDKALSDLLPLVEHELRRMARRFMAGERVDHTLQTSALINEAYIKLVNQDRTEWQNRAHFFAICARIMRRILLDHARSHGAKKRPHGKKVDLPGGIPVGRHDDVALIDFERALSQLEEHAPRQAQVLELRLYGGLTADEVAEVLEIGRATVNRDLKAAKEFVRNQLTGKIE